MDLKIKMAFVFLLLISVIRVTMMYLFRVFSDKSGICSMKPPLLHSHPPDALSSLQDYEAMLMHELRDPGGAPLARL